MKVTIDLEEELLEPALQEHLVTGKSVQNYIKSAIRFYHACRELEKGGAAIAFGEPNCIRQYLDIEKY